MTEHRPECRWPQYAKALLWGSVSRANRERVSCICKELLACEARVTTAAVQRVQALPHALECVTRDVNYSRPCNCLHGDALDAIKGQD
jgi:hypothetical protein